MNWYKGNIAEAVQKSKKQNAIFVVFVEGKDETTAKLMQFIDEEKIRDRLESDDFVAIKIESESEAYMQFAAIYQVVPVPSIFFIGKSGIPIEVGTGVIASADELEEKIDSVLIASRKNTPSPSVAPSIASFLSAEQASSSVAPVTANVATTSAPAVAQEEEVICDGDVCYKKPKETPLKEAPVDVTAVMSEPTPTATAEPPSTATIEPPPTAIAEPLATAPAEPPSTAKDTSESLEETRKLLEQKRRERLEEEKRQEKERELRRRQEGKVLQNLQQWQKEQELKELKDNIRRERLEEQAARERIRAQIAGDRAERARKFADETAKEAASAAATSSSADQAKPSEPVGASMTRLQFRFSNGDNKTHIFSVEQTLGEVRAYVKTELLAGSGVRDFILATTYPKREFTAAEDDDQTLLVLGLTPSAVILVITKESSIAPSRIIASSGGLLNIVSTILNVILSPMYAVFGYVRNAVFGRGGRGVGVGGGAAAAAAAETGAQKRANEDQGTAQQDAAKRRNLDRFTYGPSTSKDATPSTVPATDGDSKAYRRYGSSNIHRLADNRKDSDDENATWNGNSTQQQ